MLLGFTGTVRELVNKLAIRLVGIVGRMCSLRTNSTRPARNLSPSSSLGDQVLFITDVIFRGSLVDAMHELVTRVNANVFGVVSLLDRRQEAIRAEGSLSVGRERKISLRHISCGQFRTPPTPRQSVKHEYWVDPVSLVPSRKDPWALGAGVDVKIEKTLRLIQNTDAALCGHIVDRYAAYVGLHSRQKTHSSKPV